MSPAAEEPLIPEACVGIVECKGFLRLDSRRWHREEGETSNWHFVSSLVAVVRDCPWATATRL